jgi:hypothetical protein
MTSKNSDINNHSYKTKEDLEMDKIFLKILYDNLSETERWGLLNQYK